MTNDPIVDEIRRTRERLLAECGGDLERLLDRYQCASDPQRTVTREDIERRRQGQNQGPSIRDNRQ